MFSYAGLQDIMQVPEDPTENIANAVKDLNFDEKIRKLNEIVRKSVKSRTEYLQKQLTQNMKDRFVLLSKCKDDEYAQAIQIEACRRDPLYFFNMWLWTYDPRRQQIHIPFLTYPYQDRFIHELNTAVETGYDVFVEKSRDMGFSWCVLGFALRGYLFHGRSELLGSYKEDYVHEKGNMDSHFERLGYMLQRLPSWLRGEHIQKYMGISRKNDVHNAEISGDSGQMFGTGGRRKFVFLDEYQARQFDKTAMRKTKDVTLCRIFGGTPEGTGNVYGKVMTSHRDYKDVLCKKIRMLWDQHPLKTKAWYELQSLTRTTIDMAKEIDISYEASIDSAVYPHFMQQCKFGVYPYNPKLKVYRTLDFGLDMLALQIWQKDFSTNSLYVIATIQRHNRELEKFVAFLTGTPTSGYAYDDSELQFIENTRKMRKSSGDYGDPYNSDNRSVLDKRSTIKSVLASYGVHIQTDRGNTVEGRIRTATLALSRIHIDSGQTEFISAIQQSRYPSKRDSSESTTDQRKPIHDENSHHRTAFEYFLDQEPNIDFDNVAGASVDYSEYM